MTAEELERKAFLGEPVPEDIHSQADMLLFLSFRNLYDFAKRVEMPPEQGKREKAEILENYRVNKFLEELTDESVQMWKRIELAASAYAKEPCLKTADELYKAFYRTGRKERASEKAGY